MRTRNFRERRRRSEVNLATRPQPPSACEGPPLSLEALLSAHREIYGPESENRVVALLRQDLLAILNGTAVGAAYADPFDSGTSQNSAPLVAASKRNERRLTPEQVAKRLSCTTKTLANWRYNGDGRPRGFKLAGRVYYLESEIDAYEQAQINGGKH